MSRYPTAAEQRNAAETSTSARELRRLANSERWDVQRRVAANPATPARVLRDLAKSKLWAIRAGVAANPEASHSLLRTLSSDVGAVRFALAANPSCPIEAFDRLVHADPAIAARAATNPSCPVLHLRRLISSTDMPAWVIRAAAANPSCPPEDADVALTWLTLAGSAEDPTFDPVACTGRPVATGTAHEWYQARAESDGCTDALWPVRLASMNASTVKYADLEQLLADPVDTVRRRAAWFEPLPAGLIKQMRGDEVPAIAERARTVKQLKGPKAALNAPGPSGATRRILKSLAIAALAFGATRAWSAATDDSPKDMCDIVNCTGTLPPDVPLTIPSPRAGDPADDAPISADTPAPFTTVIMDASWSPGSKLAPWDLDHMPEELSASVSDDHLRLSTRSTTPMLLPPPWFTADDQLTVTATALGSLSVGPACLGVTTDGLISIAAFPAPDRVDVTVGASATVVTTLTGPPLAPTPGLRLTCASLGEHRVRVVVDDGTTVSVDRVLELDDVVDAGWSATLVAQGNDPAGTSAEVGRFETGTPTG